MFFIQKKPNVIYAVSFRGSQVSLQIELKYGEILKANIKLINNSRKNVSVTSLQ